MLSPSDTPLPRAPSSSLLLYSSQPRAPLTDSPSEMLAFHPSYSTRPAAPSGRSVKSRPSSPSPSSRYLSRSQPSSPPASPHFHAWSPPAPPSFIPRYLTAGTRAALTTAASSTQPTPTAATATVGRTKTTRQPSSRTTSQHAYHRRYQSISAKTTHRSSAGGELLRGWIERGRAAVLPSLPPVFALEQAADPSNGGGAMDTHIIFGQGPTSPFDGGIDAISPPAETGGNGGGRWSANSAWKKVRPSSPAPSDADSSFDSGPSAWWAAPEYEDMLDRWGYLLPSGTHPHNPSSRPSSPIALTPAPAAVVTGAPHERSSTDRKRRLASTSCATLSSSSPNASATPRPVHTRSRSTVSRDRPRPLPLLPTNEGFALSFARTFTTPEPEEADAGLPPLPSQVPTALAAYLSAPSRHKPSVSVSVSSDRTLRPRPSLSSVPQPPPPASRRRTQIDRHQSSPSCSAASASNGPTAISGRGILKRSMHQPSASLGVPSTDRPALQLMSSSSVDCGLEKDPRQGSRRRTTIVERSSTDTSPRKLRKPSVALRSKGRYV